MDLEAYLQIEALQPIADYNDIEVPRLRGYRLMETQPPVAHEEIEKMLEKAEVDAVRTCCSMIFDYSDWYQISDKTERLMERYLVKNPHYGQINDDGTKDYQSYIKVRWDRLHGRMRKRAKYEIKRKRARIKRQFELYNRYAGMPGVLYVHSRIGGPNWNRYKDAVIRHPNFLGHADDTFDFTYCDLYFKVIIPESFSIS